MNARGEERRRAKPDREARSNPHVLCSLRLISSHADLSRPFVLSAPRLSSNDPGLSLGILVGKFSGFCHSWLYNLLRFWQYFPLSMRATPKRDSRTSVPMSDRCTSPCALRARILGARRNAALTMVCESMWSWFEMASGFATKGHRQGDQNGPARQVVLSGTCLGR